ncbi:MAG: hypothetical protein QME35_00060 [Thermoanaerobacteraceae bacterium]|nr:hypothetical protein [Thermoanaerobacteraceae bacterium]
MKKIIAFTLTGVLLFTSGLTVYAGQKGYNPKAKTEITTSSQEGIKEQTQTNEQARDKNQISTKTEITTSSQEGIKEQTQTNEQTRNKNQISLSVKEFKGKILIKGKKVNFDIPPVLK